MAITTSLQSATDVVNAALVDIGHAVRIGNLFDGSIAAKQALSIYGQTRDEQLSLLSPGFAQRALALTVLKAAPAGGYVPPTAWNPATNPQLPWLYEYAYPADCVKVRAIRSVPLIIPEFDPQPVLFKDANDNQFAPPQRVLLCNVAAAVAIYTGRVTDPTTWAVAFTEALIAALGRRLGPALANMPQEADREQAQAEQVADVVASVTQG